MTIILLKHIEDITVEEIDEIFDQYTEPDQYNDVIQKQYDMLDKKWKMVRKSSVCQETSTNFKSVDI